MSAAITRRSFLLASLAAGCRRERPDFPIIDVHLHADFGDSLLQWQAGHLSHVSFTPEGLSAEMEANGVRQGISIGFETENSELSRTAANPMGRREAAGNIFPVGGVNPYRLDPDGLENLDQALSDKRLKGLKIYLGYYPRGPGDDAYKPVYELAGRHRVPVIFHTGDTYSRNAKVRYAHPLAIDDVAVDFREVNFVLAHLGNPWTIDAAELMYKNPNVYGDLSGFLVGDHDYFRQKRYSPGFDHVIERIRRAFGWVENPKKFLYGSDWPLVPMRPYIELMKRAIPETHHRTVFFDSARELFALG